jgi:hypothetical protein
MSSIERREKNIRAVCFLVPDFVFRASWMTHDYTSRHGSPISAIA